MVKINDLLGKKIYIYGKGKVQRDFEYIFDALRIEGYLVDKEYSGDNTISIENLEDISFDYIIICDFDFIQKAKKLESLGLKSPKDYFIADELFSNLDFPLMEKTINKEIYIWGTGAGGIKYVTDNSDVTVSAFLDNNEKKKGSYINNIVVKHPDEIPDSAWRNIYVIVASTYYAEIREQLMQYGLIEGIDFIWDKLILPKPSELLAKTIYDKAYYNLNCETMFHVFEIEQTGQVSCCCTTFVNERIGNLIYQNYDEIWKSNIHKVLCLSLNNQTYSFCKKEMCPLLLGRTAQLQEEKFSMVHYKEFNTTPKSLHISIDETCNLYCETCRSEIKVASGKNLENCNLMADKIINSILGKVNYLSMAGNGEVFLSKVYERIWKHEKAANVKQIKVLSNGLLFNEKKWSEFIEGKDAEIYLCISIDAASKESYEKIRRGGNFQILYNNMKFASVLRKEGKLSYFQINFVVQRENFKEMIDFIDWGEKLGVDKVFFTKILNWGTYTDEAFRKVSMMKDDDTPNDELQVILENDKFKLPIVDLGTINWTHNNEVPHKVTNFYDWEIQQWREK